jgi:NADPH2 dehydrogenase
MLFDPISIKQLTVKNRLCMPPMCTYRAIDGVANFFHHAHYGTMINYGIGLVIIEATSVEPNGRISLEDLGLWDDKHIAPLRHIVEYAHDNNTTIMIQLAHAGRKTAKSLPQVGPTSEAYPNYPAPSALTVAQLNALVESYRQAARRASQAGFDGIEIHAAHGYLLHSFISPKSNTRNDEYGGSEANRLRLVREILAAIQAEFSGAIGIRFSAEEYIDDGYHIEDYVRIAQTIASHGIDFIDVSSGGIYPASIDVKPGFQVPLSKAIKAAVSIPVFAVGMITESAHAEAILTAGDADIIQVGKALLRDPGLPRRWAKELGAPLELKSPLNYPSL